MKYMYKTDHIMEILLLNMLFGEWNHSVVAYLFMKENNYI